jgi:hypothetical protein
MLSEVAFGPVVTLRVLALFTVDKQPCDMIDPHIALIKGVNDLNCFRKVTIFFRTSFGLNWKIFVLKATYSIGPRNVLYINTKNYCYLCHLNVKIKY